MLSHPEHSKTPRHDSEILSARCLLLLLLVRNFTRTCLAQSDHKTLEMIDLKNRTAVTAQGSREWCSEYIYSGASHARAEHHG